MNIKANETRRNDPVLCARIREILEERSDTVASIEADLDAITAKIGYLPYQGAISFDLEKRVQRAAWLLKSEFDQWKSHTRRHTITDTYVGNMAAFELGAAVVQREDISTGEK